MNRFILIMLIGVSFCRQYSPLTLSDLKFPDPERHAIRLNKVDTTFVFYPQENGSEIRTYRVYNQEGHVIFDNTSLVDERRYYYDEFGLLNKKEIVKDGFTTNDSASYEFNADGRILNQKWIGGIENQYKFDNDGRVIEVITRNQKAEGKTTLYSYSGSQLTKSTLFWGNNKIAEAEITYFYCAENKLDSILLKARTDIRPSRFIYNDDGLLTSEFHGDYQAPTSYVHKKRS